MKLIEALYELAPPNLYNMNWSHHIKTALEASHQSTCGRKKVGAAIFLLNKPYTVGVIAKFLEKSNHQKYISGNTPEPLAIGWNGFAVNPNESRYNKPVKIHRHSCKEIYEKINNVIHPDSEKGKAFHLLAMEDEIHAENRAVNNVLHHFPEYGEELLRSSIIFTTLSPCTQCSHFLNAYGITIGSWIETYNRDRGEGKKSIQKLLIGNTIFKKASEF